MQFDTDIVQVFRSESGHGGYDICVLQNDGQIAVIHPTDEAYEDGTPGKFQIDPSLGQRVEGQFLQHDQDRDDNRFTFIKSMRDTGEILLNCYFRRKFYPLTHKFGESLHEETNFVFLFSESDVTRFII